MLNGETIIEGHAVMGGDFMLEPGGTKEEEHIWETGWVPGQGYEMHCRWTYQIVCMILAASAESK